jgi:hypothetical protein
VEEDEGAWTQLSALRPAIHGRDAVEDHAALPDAAPQLIPLASNAANATPSPPSIRLPTLTTPFGLP